MAAGDRPVTSVLRFALVAAALIGALAWGLGFLFEGADGRRAVWVSAGVAFAVQLVAFSLARARAGGTVIAAWGVGALLRLGVLALYGLVVARGLGLDQAAALVSLAAFFFLSTLVEPLLLKT